MGLADRFVDGTTFPQHLRMYSSASPGALSIPAHHVNARFAEWLRSIGKRPFFAYLNWQEMHFPYSYPGAPLRLLDRPVPRGSIVPANREWVRKTYANAARTLDDALSEVIRLMDSLAVGANTVIIVVGDHGEELFENGYLGHGTHLSYEQNATLGKLIGSKWTPPERPLGLSDLPAVIHNALVRRSEDVLPLSEEVLCYVGVAERPLQIGLFTGSGLVKYDFVEARWERQERPQGAFARAVPEPHLVHLWESYAIRALPKHSPRH
jgi:hypothetical protein